MNVVFYKCITTAWSKQEQVLAVLYVWSKQEQVLAVLYVWIFRKAEAERCIMMAAKIIAPAIEESFSDGYDW